MPETFYQWLWFLFFTVGSLGGWLALASFLYWLRIEYQKGKTDHIVHRLLEHD